MKKFISIVLCLSLVASTCAFFASASGEVKGEISEYPVIIVPGYSSSHLYYGDDIETGEHVWNIQLDLIEARLLANIAQLGIGLGAIAFDHPEYFAKTIGTEFDVMFEKMRCNPDGSPVYELHNYYTSAHDTNRAWLLNEVSNGITYCHENDMAKEFAEYIGDENIYNFNCDFRKNVIDIAGDLDVYIQDVKAYTGKDKVNLLAVSHGGQVSATYLNLYGYKGDVENAVLTVPAIGGAAVTYDLATQTIDFDEECLIRFIENGTMTEENYNWLVKANELGFLDNVFNALVPYLLEVLGYWGSVWDFIETDRYEEVKALLLDSEECAPLIARSDKYHYEVLPKMRERLTACIENGTNISIIAGTGNRLVTGYKKYSDGIISVESSTGAKTAPYGKRFADGYVQAEPCDGKNKVSPMMDIDASTAYLPDNTWFIDNLFHGMTYWDDYTRVLMMTTLFTDNITSVYSDKNFPQFKYSTNPSLTVYAEFDGCAPGYITSDSKTLNITNCSKKGNVRINAVYVEGIDLRVKVDPFKKLAPGETVSFEVKGSVPEVSAKAVNITVCYTIDNITPIGYRTQTFTVDNGAAVAGGGEPVDSESFAPFDLPYFKLVTKALELVGLKEFSSMIYMMVYYWVDTVVHFVVK